MDENVVVSGEPKGKSKTFIWAIVGGLLILLLIGGFVLSSRSRTTPVSTVSPTPAGEGVLPTSTVTPAITGVSPSVTATPTPKATSTPTPKKTGTPTPTFGLQGNPTNTPTPTSLPLTY